jgi:hypothetical protein
MPGSATFITGIAGARLHSELTAADAMPLFATSIPTAVVDAQSAAQME